MNDVALDVGPTEPIEPARPVAPGALLREARERQGLSLADVARHLKLSQRQVEALERDNFAALPGPVFVRGFMRNYARLVALDAAALVTAAEATPGFPLPPASSMSQTVSHPVVASAAKARRDGPRGKRAWWPVTAILIVAAIALIYFRGHETVAPQEPTEVSLSVPAVAPEAVSETTPAVAAPMSTDAAATKPSEMPSTEVAGSPAAPLSQPLATSVPPGPVAAASAPAAAVESSAATGADPTAPGESFAAASVGGGSGEVRLNFARDAWVEIKDATGSIVFSQLNTAGSERVVRGRPPFQLVVGNASGVTVTYNSREVDLAPHTRTDVARFTLE